MSERASQVRCTELVLSTTPDAAVVSNLGVASCVLAGVEDRPENCYLWGSMGSTTAVGLGIALETDRQVTVLDGDGSTLMSLGTLATVAKYAPATLTVVVFDNGEFATTGGQRTRADTADIAGVARECGLASERVESDGAFADAYERAVAADEPRLVVCAVETESPETLPPMDFAAIARRFRDVVGQDT